MATISTLAVNLIARTSVFDKKMRNSRTNVKTFKTTAMSATAGIARFAKGLALAAGIGGMGFMIKRTMAMIDQTAKLSDRLGIATEDLIGLRHAANIAGVATESLDKALEIFTRRMGEVKSGSGEATRGLDALGLSAQQLISKTPSAGLKIIADKIKTLGTQAEKSAAAYFLFGRSGAQLLNLFEQGSAGIAKAQAEAVKLGLTFNRFDAAKVEAANDAITKLKGSMSGVTNEVVIKLAPAIKSIADFMTKYRNSIISTIKNSAIFIAKTYIIVKVLKLATSAVMFLVRAYKALAAGQIITLSLGGPAGWAAIATGAAIAASAIIGLNEVIDGTVKGLGAVVANSAALEDVGGKTTALDNTADILKEIARTKKTIAAADKLNEGFIGSERNTLALEQEKKLEALRARLIGVRVANEKMARKQQLNADLENIRKLDSQALDSLSEFANKISEELADVGLSPMDAEIAKLERFGKGLSGEAFKQYNRNLKDAIALVDQLEAAENAITRQKEMQSDIVSQMKEKAAGAAEIAKINIAAGKFQEIRTDFIDVAALNPTGKTNQESLLEQINTETVESNRLLKTLIQQDQGIFLT